MTVSDFSEPPRADAPRVRASDGTWVSRLGRALLLLVLFVVIPMTIAGWLAGPHAGFAATLGAVLAISSAMTNGRRATRYALPLMMLALVLGAVTKPVLGRADEAPLNGWLWVVVVMAFAIASGLSTRYGVGVALATATLYAVIAPPFRDLSSLAFAVAFLTLGSVYGWLIAGRLGATADSQSPPASVRSSRLIALFLGVAAGLATSIVVLLELPNSVWIATAVVVLGIPTPGFTEGAILKRMIGQVLACTVVAGVSWLILQAPPEREPLLFGVATLLCILGYLMAFSRPLQVQIAYLSAAIMMPVASRHAQEVDLVVGDRLLYNTIGLAILGAALLAVRVWATESRQPPLA